MRFLVYISIVFILPCFFTSCENKDKNIFNGAEWISDGRILPENDSLFYQERPAPIFRKEFIIDKEIRLARLLISSAGYYRFSVNGIYRTDNILSPAWTEYSKRVCYSEYNITSSLQEGMNSIGVTLGNGFYNPLPLRMWGHLNLREKLPVGKPCFIARIIIEYSNGSVEEVKTDDSWKFSFGPLMRNNVYLGVVYDQSYEQPGWEQPGFIDNQWNRAAVIPGPGGELKKRFFPPVVVTDTINPVKIYDIENNSYIVDMGINFTGVYLARLKGKAGDSVVFRFGERVYESGKLNPMTTVCGQIKGKGTGGPGAPDIAWQADTYIFDKDTVVCFLPDFTYHTYRYMEIRGLDYKPDITDIMGLSLSTDLYANSFNCSSSLIDSIQGATVRTFRANLIGVQSDCPAREKFGYGGDLNATSEAFIMNFDMREFYRKTVYDWVDAINDTIFVDTAPYVGINYCGLSWESAFLITQYYLYLYYNDTDIVEELYECDKNWMDKVARIHPSGVVNSGLSDHESLERAPVELTGTAHYLQCARIMQKFAELMNDKKGLDKYTGLASKLSDRLTKDFWLEPKYEVDNKQVLFSVLLYFDLVPDEDRKAVTDSLLYYIDKAGGHFTTGIFGTRYILSALSETGNVSTAFKVVNNTGYPGWGHMISKGATTIWETWRESDNTFSNCHPMFGSISEWFYKNLAGINPDPENPGFSKFILSPGFPDGLEYVNCSYKSEPGLIVSGWRKGNDHIYYYNVQIPEKSEAIIILPCQKFQLSEIKDLNKKDSIDLNSIKDPGKFVLPGGRYEIILKTVEKTYNNKL